MDLHGGRIWESRLEVAGALRPPARKKNILPFGEKWPEARPFAEGFGIGISTRARYPPDIVPPRADAKTIQ